ncbi:MAG: AraC family transcriptional regulator [Sphingobacteriales bacterium JAD_PAG50586_3]|nr:MAG: AraC family transcriptional regulator [Sphingobacteriales bacterium JAD_PAG50586_3]
MFTLYIKNMVCHRCILAVEGILNNLALPFKNISLGEVILDFQPATGTLQTLSAQLSAIGFEILDDKQNIIIEKIKKAIQQYLENAPSLKSTRLSTYLADKLHYEYTYLSDLFSSTESISIEQYFIRLRIEKAKELLVYNNLNGSEIADLLGYSSVNHFSAQFKKVTGVTPSAFKNIGRSKRLAIDKV